MTERFDHRIPARLSIPERLRLADQWKLIDEAQGSDVGNGVPTEDALHSLWMIGPDP
jgi:hypothetical protein